MGKHFLELFSDPRYKHTQEQIQLTHKMCNTVYCWFGENKFTNKIELDDLMINMFMFYRQIEHKLPIQMERSQTPIGYLAFRRTRQRYQCR